MTSNRKEVPRKVHVVVRVDIFEIQLWWEISPWSTMVVSREKGKIPDVGHDGEVISCLGRSVGREEESPAEEGLQVLQQESFRPAHAMAELVFSRHGGCNILEAVGMVPPMRLDVAVRTRGLLVSKAQEGGQCVSGPATAQVLQIKGGPCMTSPSTAQALQLKGGPCVTFKGLTKGFLLGWPLKSLVMCKLRRDLGLPLVPFWRKGCITLKTSREKDRNKEVCANPLIHEWHQDSEERFLRADDALLAEATGLEVGETLFGFFFLRGWGRGRGGESCPLSLFFGCNSWAAS